MNSIYPTTTDLEIKKVTFGQLQVTRCASLQLITEQKVKLNQVNIFFGHNMQHKQKWIMQFLIVALQQGEKCNRTKGKQVVKGMYGHNHYILGFIFLLFIV